jgi:hypothetical protein
LSQLPRKGGEAGAVAGLPAAQKAYQAFRLGVQLYLVLEVVQGAAGGAAVQYRRRQEDQLRSQLP